MQMMCYKYHKVNFSHCSSYIDHPGRIKKETNKSKNENDKCFQYVVTVALNYEEIKWNLERFPTIKPFIKKYIGGKK